MDSEGLCGAGRGTEIAVFAKTRLELLRQFVPLDPEAFRAAFMRFMAVSDTLVRAAQPTPSCLRKLGAVQTAPPQLMHICIAGL